MENPPSPPKKKHCSPPPPKLFSLLVRSCFEHWVNLNYDVYFLLPPPIWKSWCCHWSSRAKKKDHFKNNWSFILLYDKCITHLTHSLWMLGYSYEEIGTLFWLLRVFKDCVAWIHSQITDFWLIYFSEQTSNLKIMW